MEDLNKGKELLGQIMADIPEAAELNEDQQRRLERAIEKMATLLFLYPSTKEGGLERKEMDIKLAYAKTTITALGALTYAKVQNAVEEAVKQAFITGVRIAVASLA